MIVAVDPKLAAVVEMVVAGTAVGSDSVGVAELEPLVAIPPAVAAPNFAVMVVVAGSIPVAVPGIAVAVVPAPPVP